MLTDRDHSGTRAIQAEGSGRRGRRADRQRVSLAGQCGQCGRYLGEARADVGGHGLSSPAVVLVAGVGLGSGEAEVTLTGRERFTNCVECLSSEDGAMRLLPSSLRL